MDKTKVINDDVFWTVRDELNGLTLAEVQKAQKDESLPFAVCALNLDYGTTTGIIARTACLHGVQEFMTFGYPAPARKQTPDTQHYIPISRIDGIDSETDKICLMKFEKAMNDLGCYPVAIEQGGARIDLLNDGEWEEILTSHSPLKPCLVFGNERRGIPEEILNACAYTLTLPQRGVLRSFNVGAAAAIAIHYVSNELLKRESHD